MRRFEKKLWALMSGRFCILHLSLVTIMTLGYVITTQHSSKVFLIWVTNHFFFSRQSKTQTCTAGM